MQTSSSACKAKSERMAAVPKKAGSMHGSMADDFQQQRCKMRQHHSIMPAAMLKALQCQRSWHDISTVVARCMHGCSGQISGVMVVHGTPEIGVLWSVTLGLGQAGVFSGVWFQIQEGSVASGMFSWAWCSGYAPHVRAAVIWLLLLACVPGCCAGACWQQAWLHAVISAGKEKQHACLQCRRSLLACVAAGRRNAGIAEGGF